MLKQSNKREEEQFQKPIEPPKKVAKAQDDAKFVENDRPRREVRKSTKTSVHDPDQTDPLDDEFSESDYNPSAQKKKKNNSQFTKQIKKDKIRQPTSS